MLRKALVPFFVVASLAACIGCGSTSNHFVYATIPAASQIIAYREDPNSGVLTQISGSPYSVGEGAISLVLHPSGKFLYVANPGLGGTAEDDISLFTIASDGTLKEVTPRAPLGSSASQPRLLVMDPAGSFLYVMNAGSSNISLRIKFHLSLHDRFLRFVGRGSRLSDRRRLFGSDYNDFRSLGEIPLRGESGFQ